MLNKIIPKSEFSRNVLALMTGTTIAQAIPVAISPILSRIYTPEDFGVLALFVAITSIFGSIANARYELAIMLPEKDEDALNITVLGFTITVLLSVILFVIVLLFNDWIVEVLDNTSIRNWLYWVPIVVLFLGLFNALNYFNTRLKNYKDIAGATIVKAMVLAIVQLGLGFIKKGATGLVTGQIVSQFFANTRLIKNVAKDKELRKSIQLSKMKEMATRYIDFPKYSMWAILSNTLSIQLTNILISSFYSVKTLGLYSLVQRVLGMPSLIIGNSVGQVFFQEATREKQLTGKAVVAFRGTLKKLIAIGLPSFGILFFVVEDLFAVVFGEDWRVAGTYGKIMIPLFLMRFVTSSVTVINSIFEMQLISLLWQVSLLVTSVLALYVSNLKALGIEMALIILVVLSMIHYFILLAILMHVSKGN